MISKFFRGFIDGALSTLGIVVGASSASSSVIIAAGIGGAFANGISNVLSAFSAERVDQYKELRKIEKAMVAKELKGSAVEENIHLVTLHAGMIDGLATIVGGALPISPYFWLASGPAMIVSSSLVVVSILGVGMYLGKVSRRSMFIYGIKMALFGILVAVAVYYIQLLIVP
ncbi:MAG: VIT1/CCC1 transporter family protein [Thermodesulfobacteriota bacterium]